MSELEHLSLQDNSFHNNRQRFSCPIAHTSPQWHSAASAPGYSEKSSVSSYTLSGETTEAVLLMACTPSSVLHDSLSPKIGKPLPFGMHALVLWYKRGEVNRDALCFGQAMR